ncbi:(2Fe-2S)-binding protein [Labrys monachus]|uniref:Aerobic-type carbon monoxide dehydrogenase small subunit (CoxS/CutS family) n=1 Tax=Labrys monachus TaxID=217067 RepID=A0ABU0FIB8_9HYPH|nr:(2Fe-2S)-binding protein [Labrys monachus]MDQ0394358.1 aerobic-type carbon monoxide dehydrogenase small subunit (CoxS/CutS family) [Labrys monachus]
MTVIIDGSPVEAPAGMPIGALLHARDATLRLTGDGRRRGLFCGMGLCFDCLVLVDGREAVRACITPAADGMRIVTGRP